MQSKKRLANEDDGGTDDLLCKKFGFKPNTQNYANCRLIINIAKNDLQQQQSQFLSQQQALKEAQDKDKKMQQSTFMLGMGLRMMIGQSASGAAVDQSIGALFFNPTSSNNMRTYTFSNDKQMTCTTTGSFTDCF
jgi:hypothetical protein